MHRDDRILAVDDHVDNLLILKEILENEYTVLCATSGEEALRVAPQFRPNLILLDVMMPGLDGNQTCDLMRGIPELANTKVVMVSARSDLGDRLAAYGAGAVDYITKPFHDQEVLLKVRAWMQMAYKQQVDAIWQEAERTREVLGCALVNMAAFRDTETGEHLFRMRWYSETLAEELAVAGPYSRQIDDTFLRQLYWASPLHDIGKVGIDDSILRKPGRLNAEEFETIKQHAVIGADILAKAAASLPHADYMCMAVEIARYHHERFDGSGYPEGLVGLAIPLAARIVAVADVFDALTSTRVYKRAVSAVEAARTILEQSGVLFDPVIVDAFRARFADFRHAQVRFTDGSLLTSSPLRIGAVDNPVDRSEADHVDYSPGTRVVAAV